MNTSFLGVIHYKEPLEARRNVLNSLAFSGSFFGSYTNPCLEVVLSIEENLFLFKAFFEVIALAIADKNNEEEGKILP
ncbi:MAG: hypothetical protein ACPG19_02625 [Saprospiraceae bacterium]